MKSKIKNQKSKISGLTLIEVMLALAILGIGIVALVAAASECLSVVRKARHYEAARRLLPRIELENPLFAEEEIEPTSDGGNFPSPYAAYSWTRTIEQEGEEEDGMFKITMEVQWADRSKQSRETVVTYLYAPTETKGGSFESR